MNISWSSLRGHIRFPVGYTFNDTSTNQSHVLEEVSACAWDPRDPSGRRLVLISDSGSFIIADIDITPDGQLAGIALNKYHNLEPSSGGRLDAEGVAFARRDGNYQMFVASEESTQHDGQKSLNGIFTCDDKGHCEETSFQISSNVTRGAVENGGLKSLGASADGEWLFTTSEFAVGNDAAMVRRLMQFEVQGSRGPASTAAYHAETSFEVVEDLQQHSFGVVELKASPFDPDALLSLERHWSLDSGIAIRLWHLPDANTAADVTACTTLSVNSKSAVHATHNCSGGLQKQLVFSWSAPNIFFNAQTGEQFVLPVDNYEAFCVAPAHLTASGIKHGMGTRLVLLINDDNANYMQIGTQFVLMALHANFSIAPATTEGITTTTEMSDTTEELFLFTFIRNEPRRITGVLLGGGLCLLLFIFLASFLFYRLYHQCHQKSFNAVADVEYGRSSRRQLGSDGRKRRYFEPSGEIEVTQFK